jgi:hypothetical protein
LDASILPFVRKFSMRLVPSGALVKLVASWVKVPPAELDGSRLKRGIRDEAAKPNHKRDAEWNCRVAMKMNLIQ